LELKVTSTHVTFLALGSGMRIAVLVHAKHDSLGACRRAEAGSLFKGQRAPN
jgi:hypothetical protein